MVVNPSRFGASRFHRYWRLFILTNNGDTNYIAAVNVQFRDEAGVNQIPSGGTASASSAAAGGGAAEGFQAYATSTDPYWSTNFAVANQWLKWDFGAGNEKDIRSFTITGVREADRMPNDFRLEWSDDDVNWTQLGATIMNQSGWAIDGSDTRVFTP